MVPILSTKIMPPQSCPHIIIRHELFSKLHEGIKRKVTLISACEGWGKTTLLTSFLESHEIPFVWYSLGEEDNTPNAFFAHISKGLMGRFDNIGEKTFMMVQEEKEDITWQAIVASLFNEIVDNINERFLLVLDDAHSIGESKIMRDVLCYMIKYCPAKIHIIVSTREKIDMQFGKFGGQGTLLEIGKNDLKFGKDEIDKLFIKRYNIKLTFQELETLYNYTEGWVTYLILIGDLVNESPVKKIVPYINNGNNTRERVFPYFDEIFLKLPENMQLFLKETSIMNSFDHAISEFVTEKSDTKEMLDMVLGKGLFINKLDENGRWYRYHSVFRDFLYNRLKEECPGNIKELHRKSALYFKKIGNEKEAFYHSILADDYESAEEFVIGAIDCNNCLLL